MVAKSVHIEKLLNELRQNYLAELPARFDQLDNLILGLNKSPTLADDYMTLYRHVHSIKGSSGTHNLHIFSKVCHEFEDNLTTLQNNITDLQNTNIDTWLQFVDLLRRAHAGIQSNQNDFSEIENELDVIRTKDSRSIYRCLLVSPSKLQRQICESLFRNINVSLCIVNDGYDALGTLLTTKFNFLITNHEISMLNGTSLISAIRTNNSLNRDIPSVLLTSNEPKILNRKTDPDYIVKKNNHLAENLTIVINEIVEELKFNNKTPAKM